MSRRTLLERLDDWINPIVIKELRQAVRSKLVVAGLFLFLLLQLLFLSVFLLTKAGQRGSLEGDLRAGREAFMFLQGILMAICLLIPFLAGIRLAFEHSDTNQDLLFISTLRPRAIVAGKLFSAMVLALLVFSACAPFMVFTYLLRGLDIPSILFLLYIDLLVILWAVQFCLFLAVTPVPWMFKIVLGLGALFWTVCLWFGVMGMSYGVMTFGSETIFEELFDHGRGGAVGAWAIWGPLLAFTVGILGQVGLFFVCSVALLTPPAANRALVVRAYLVFFWLATGVMAYWMSHLADHVAPLCMWMFVVTLLFSFGILVSINERESWGSRMARTIPRRWWLRVPAFLLYSGSAGGVLFGVLFLGLTVTAGCVALELNPMWQDAEWLVAYTRFALEFGLYTICYCLSAVCLRHYLLRGQFRIQFTWVAALLLLGLGSVLPYMIAYFFYPDALKYGNLEKDWLVTSPFEYLEIDDRRHRHFHGHGMMGPFAHWTQVFDTMPQLVLTIWAFGVGVLAMPWAVAQMMRFKPARRDRAARDKMVPVEPIEVPVNVLPDGLPRPVEGNGERVALEGSEHVTASPPTPTAPPGSFVPPSGEPR